MQRAQFTGITTPPLDQRRQSGVSVSVRRIALLLLLLLASHAAVFWLGRPRPALQSSAPATAAIPDQRDPSLSPERLRQRLKERMEAPDRIKAARDKIPAHADVAAMVRTATQGLDPVESRVLDARTLAAYGMWLDRDPFAALRWLGEWDPHGKSEEIGRALLRHLKEGGNFAKLGTYLSAVPELRKHLTSDTVKECLKKESDAATRVAAATGLPGQKERLEWLSDLLDGGADLKGQMALIRASLDPGKAAEFLRRLACYYHPDASLLEEIRGAGFPAAALAQFERVDEDQEADRAKKRAEEEAETAVPWSERLRQWESSNNYLPGPGFTKLCPDYEDWCAEVGDGRMDPDEVVSRVAAALSVHGEASEAILRKLLFREFYEDNPRAAVAWLQKSGHDAKGLLAHTAGLLASQTGRPSPPVPVEVQGELLATVLGNEISPASILDVVCESRVLDPSQVRELMEKLPACKLKEELATELKRRAEE